MGRSFFMAPLSQPRNWHSLNLETVTTNLSLLYIHWLLVQKRCTPAEKGLIKSKSNIITRQGRKSSTWWKHGFYPDNDFWIKVPCKGRPFLQGIKEALGHREEGKLRGRSEGCTGQWREHGLLNSFSFGKKKKDILCTRSLFLKQTLVVLIYTTACS